MSDDPFPELAVGLKADADAKRQQEPEEAEEPAFKATYNNKTQPRFPVRGESWRHPVTGEVKYWHGSGWYLEPPKDELERVDDLPEGEDPEPAEEESDPQQPDVPDEGQQADEEESPAFIEPEGADGPMIVDPVADQLGDGGNAEREHLTSIDAMVLAAEELVLNSKSLVDDVRDFLLEQIKHRPKPWSATSQAEQRDIAAACEQNAKELVRKTIEAVAVGRAANPIRCLLESFVEKDGIKVTLKVKPIAEEDSLAAIVGLHKARGKHVMLTVAALEDYSEGRDVETDPDEPQLGFEAGTDEYPDDDSDLAGDDENEDSES